MTLNMLLDFLIGALDVTLILLFVKKFLRNVNTDWKRTFIVILLQAIINYTLGEILGNGNPVGLMVLIITTGILYKLIFRENLFGIFMFIFLALILMFVAEGIAILIVYLLGVMPNEIHTQILPKILAVSISKSIYFVIVSHFIPKIKFSKSINRTVLYQILLVCVFNIIIILIALWFYQNLEVLSSKGNSANYIVYTTIGAIIFSLCILGITNGIINHSQKEAEWQLKEQEYKRQVFYVDNTQAMLKSINSQRHDFNNHINCLYGLLKLNKGKEAEEYIERLVDEINEFNIVVDAGNPILTALLNTKLMIAQKDKIYMEVDVDLPEKMNIESIDLSIIVGNLLDNALEACKGEDLAYKYIEVDMNIRNNNLIIKVCNSKSSGIKADLCNNKVNYTSKKDASNHGFGLNNIRQAVEKYDGIVKFEDKGECFISNIAIPISI
ncbi:MAG: GHKL domain-containing protein [Lutisporaceae bacterium]